MADLSPQLVVFFSWILLAGYPVMVAVLVLRRRQAEIVWQSVLWFTGWCLAIVVADMADPAHPYEWGPAALLFTVPASALAGAMVGSLVSLILPRTGGRKQD